MNILKSFRKRHPEVSPHNKQSIIVTEAFHGNPDIHLAGYQKMTVYAGDKQSRSELMNTYQRMMLDDRVSQVIEVVSKSVKNLEWKIVGDDPRVSDFVETNLNRLPIRKFIGNLLDARIYGYAVFEEVWEVHEGAVILKDERYLPFERIEFDVDQYGNLSAVLFDGKVYPSNWFHVFTYPEVRPDSYYYGISDLRKIYREWYTKDVLKKYRNLGLENFSFPVVVAVYDENRYPPGSPQWEELMALINGIKDDARIAMPGVFDVTGSQLIPEVELKFLQPDYSSNGFTALEQAIESENKAISRNLGLPDDLGFTDTHIGSWAKAREEMSLFQQTVLDIAGIIEDSIQEVIGRIVEYNFNNVSGDVRFKFIINDEENRDHD